MGTCIAPVQDELQWDCDRDLAADIACHNRDGAENPGYWRALPAFQSSISAAKEAGVPLNFYDVVTGKLLFVAPQGRSWEDFLEESTDHGWCVSKLRFFCFSVFFFFWFLVFTSSEVFFVSLDPTASSHLVEGSFSPGVFAGEFASLLAGGIFSLALALQLKFTPPPRARPASQAFLS